MKLRKMTFQVYVDQDSKEWHKLFDTLLSGEPVFVDGICLRSSSEGWVLTDELSDALIWAHNSAIDKDPTNAD